MAVTDRYFYRKLVDGDYAGYCVIVDTKSGNVVDISRREDVAKRNCSVWNIRSDARDRDAVEVAAEAVKAKERGIKRWSWPWFKMWGYGIAAMAVGFIGMHELRQLIGDHAMNFLLDGVLCVMFTLRAVKVEEEHVRGD